MRNYKLNPLKKDSRGHFIEIPSYNELYHHYIELNKTAVECSKYFNIPEVAFRRFLKRYNIYKPVELHNDVIKRLTKEKHGSENYRNVEKAKETYKKKWGEYNISKTNYFRDFISNNKDKIMSKIYNTKRKNNSFNISHIEDRIYNEIVKKYPSVIRQYHEKRYPFYCDFYIPERDLFIEYQGNWTHGGEPYIGTPEQQEKINLWKSKNTAFYNKAISDWSIRDVLKRKTAKDNKLNWIEFFNYNDFIEWFNNQ